MDETSSQRHFAPDYDGGPKRTRMRTLGHIFQYIYYNTCYIREALLYMHISQGDCAIDRHVIDKIVHVSNMPIASVVSEITSI